MDAPLEWANAYDDSVWNDPQGLAEMEARFAPSAGQASGRITGSNRFVWLNADVVEPAPVSWLVKGLLPLWGLVFLYGPSGAGKSFFVLWLAAQIAAGRKVFGGRTLRSGVGYIAAEGGVGVLKRIKGLRIREGVWDGRIALTTVAPNLCDEKDFDELRSALVTMKEKMAAEGDELRLVIIDTMAASTPGADENSGQDMGKLLARLQALSATLKVCIVIVAHVGKYAERGIRGWSGLLANADGAIELLAKNDDGTVVGHLVKVKDGEAGAKFAFALEQVPVGVDEDGDPETTCVIEWREVPSAPKAKPKRKSYTEAEPEEVLRAFDAVVRERPFPVLPHLAKSKEGVLLDDLREHLFRAGFREETKPEDPSDTNAYSKWKDARRSAFNRAAQSLYTNGKLRKEGQVVWVP